MPMDGIALDPDPSSLSEEEALYMAKLAESAERYDEMTQYMNQCVSEKNGDDLTHEQRNLISVGYKNLMSARRTAWRQVTGALQQPSDGKPDFKARGEEYEAQIIDEVKALIKEVEDVVVNKFTGADQKYCATKTEVKVFFKKMEGDYNRYGAEVTQVEDPATGPEAKIKARSEFTEKAKKAYQDATEECEKQVPKGTNKHKEDPAENPAPGPDVTETEDELPPTNPIRLGLALNYSVFMYEILEEKDGASKVAQDAFDKAIEKLDELNEEQYRDSTLIMQLLKDNLNLWMGGEEHDGYQ